MNEKITVITGTVGEDSHTIGTRLLSRVLKDNGFKVVELGPLTPPEEFIHVARETAADAILASSLYGMAEIDLANFKDSCREAGLKDLILYLGGYLLVTATSSPGQRILGTLRDDVREEAHLPDARDEYLPVMTDVTGLSVLSGDWRIVFGVAGFVLLMIAVVLVLPHSMMATRETVQALQQGIMPPYVEDWLAQIGW